ncbi:MAG: Ppx/GppA phosphatase family protein [Bacillota bacterium]|jgi:exopolyphosphatase/guanosine-5'-triphosphate,3'-diphosphate pyrophosphatase|nr:Ppx/GppA phosphatase family protein [Bacillota bacterium]MDI9414849.1 Ppx/GppA phosphatase family protein [Bacillota bacterium]HOB89535.1 Ppx/GppA phosphatase family protein [Bacillota bacterium]HOJ58564.1 Ppx/GppA phosphatase family protein [Bacillota bacterium]HPO81251.1 Ppx/GppA phosphatase family protein [Bacillota bacterium]
MDRKAVIDIGTNSIKLYVAELGPDGSLATVIDKNNIARLGEGMDEERTLQQEAIRRNAEAVAEFADLAKSNGAGEIVAVGTMALRTAKNAKDFIDAVRDLSGIEVRVIPGEEEAEFAYLAVLSGIGASVERLAVCDVGGGSTEFIFGGQAGIDRRFSINLGAVKVSADYLSSDPPSSKEVEDAISYVLDVLKENGVNDNMPVDKLVGIGGTITSMGAVKFKMEKYDPDVIQGSILTRDDVDRLIALFRSVPLDERRNIVGLQPKRAEVIIGGACIVRGIMESLGTDELTMSDRGLRHGLMFRLFQR